MIRARLRLFGEQTLTPGPDLHASPVDLSSPHVQTLLAYLALHAGQPLDRRVLAFSLWPDTTEANALRHLRQHLHRLRQVLAALTLPADILTSKGGQVRFKPDPALWVDVLQFQQQIGDRYRQIEAIELYRGDLLPGQAAEWLPPLRGRLREQYQEALRGQIAIAHMQRNYPRACHYARRLLDSDPLGENSHRVYMEALYLNGERAQALQHFSHLKELLAGHLNAEPMPQTISLYQQIQAGTLPGDMPPLAALASPVQALAALPPTGETFVGRQAELAHLDEALAAALNGWGRFVLVEGESGLGKTSLLEVWRQARAGQMLVFGGQAHPAETGIPAAPVLAALRQGCDRIDWGWFPPGSPWSEQVGRLLGGPADRLPPLPGEGPVSPLETSAAWPLVHQLGQFFLALAAHARQPVGLFLDDLHHADPVTWQLLAVLARRCNTVPLLLVCAGQPNLFPAAGRRLLRSLRGRDQLQVIELPPLSPADTARLAGLLRPDSAALDPLLVHQLYRVSEGNPFFITEFLKAVPAGPGGGTLPPLPKTVRAVILARLGQLAPLSQELLAVAAAIGRRFNFRVLAGISQYSQAQLLAALESWLDAGLVVERSEGYEFTHEQIYSVAYDCLNPADRPQVHQRIARAYAALEEIIEM